MPQSETPRPLVGERLKNLTGKLTELRTAIQEIERTIEGKSGNYWPSDAPSSPAKWHTRTETPPAALIWASDGETVWLIHSDGKPIPGSATAVRYWTQAYIPAPPREIVIDA